MKIWKLRKWIVIVGVALLIVLALVLAVNVFIPKSNKNFEELQNASIKETSFYKQTKESLIYGTWKPLFEDVLSNYNNYMLMENLFKDKDLGNEVLTVVDDDTTCYNINRNGLRISYIYQNGYLLGMVVDTFYNNLGRIGILSDEHLSMKDVNAAVLMDMLTELANNNLSVYTKVEGNTLYFYNIEDCIEPRQETAIEDIVNRNDVTFEDLEGVLNLYKNETEEKNGRKLLFEDNLICPACFDIKHSVNKVVLEEDRISIFFKFDCDINEKTKEFLESLEKLEDNEKWENLEIVKKLKEWDKQEWESLI